MLSALAADDSRSSLARLIESVSFLTPIGGRARRVDQLPDGRTRLVFRVLSGGASSMTVIGPRTRAHFKDATGVDRAAVIAFKPGWATPFLGVAASELANTYVDLEEIWGPSAHALCGELTRATSAGDVCDFIASAYARRIERPFEPSSARLARRAVRWLESENVRIDSVAKRLGVTSRHLRRAFVENVGVGPKEFARSARLQLALALSSRSSDWARIAASAGYYDQSHLIADFHDLVGLSPSAYLARSRERHPLEIGQIG